MNTSPTVKRRTVYVDGAVQKWLLITLVTLEIMLISAALWMLYIQLNDLLEANLYRSHFSDKPHIYPLLLKNALIGLSGLVVINIVVLWVADRLWSRHVNSILHPVIELLSKVEALDFREDVPVSVVHRVIGLAHRWRKTEHERLLKLRAEIAKLEAENVSTAGKEQTRVVLATICKLLP
ncbi:MAG: hypothetical protein Q7S51_07520 [Gallionellaceae bacterium]|nr:hypothetical protein [Gallionellaceae bacterium]